MFKLRELSLNSLDQTIDTKFELKTEFFQDHKLEDLPQGHVTLQRLNSFSCFEVMIEYVEILALTRSWARLSAKERCSWNSEEC